MQSATLRLTRRRSCEAPPQRHMTRSATVSPSSTSPRSAREDAARSPSQHSPTFSQRPSHGHRFVDQTTRHQTRRDAIRFIAHPLANFIFLPAEHDDLRRSVHIDRRSRTTAEIDPTHHPLDLLRAQLLLGSAFSAVSWAKPTQKRNVSQRIVSDAPQFPPIKTIQC